MNICAIRNIDGSTRCFRAVVTLKDNRIVRPVRSFKHHWRRLRLTEEFYEWTTTHDVAFHADGSITHINITFDTEADAFYFKLKFG